RRSPRAGRRLRRARCPARSRARLVRSRTRVPPGRHPRRPRVRFPGAARDTRGALGRAHARGRHGPSPDRGAPGPWPRAEGGTYMISTVTIVSSLIAALLGGVVVWLVDGLRRRRVAELEAAAHTTGSRIVEEARKEGDAIRKAAQGQARDLLVQAKADW